MWTNWNSCLGGGNIKLQLNLESTRHKTITFHYRKFSSLFYILVYEPLFLYIDNSGVSFICCGFLIVLKPFVADYCLCPNALSPMLALFHILSPQASYQEVYTTMSQSRAPLHSLPPHLGALPSSSPTLFGPAHLFFPLSFIAVVPNL